jgi:cytosine deaminase
MSGGESRQVVERRLKRAHETVEEAHLMVEHGHWNTAVNRLYYAVFYAAHAYLAAHGHVAKTHKGTRLAFGSLVHAQGKIPDGVLKIYHELITERDNADYGFFTDMEEEQVIPLFEPVRALISAIERALAEHPFLVGPDEFMLAAIAEARLGRSQGGIPIGSVLVRDGMLIARGHNKRVQEKNPILHGEMDCLNNAGRIGSYKGTVIYSTLMPCYMCAGTIVQFKIKKVIVGESRTFAGSRAFMESHGVEVIDLDLPECVQMMEEFIAAEPELWNEDIGE